MRDTPSDRLAGKIVRWNLEKGFGWVRTPSSRRDYFLHAADLPWEWRPKEAQKQLAGQTVTFAIATDMQRRERAAAVFVVHPEGAAKAMEVSR